jgi:DNA invertase Pin-like site-specific DNA recombinase
LFADFERSIIVERTKAGMERAKREGKRIGRPTNLNDGLIESIKYMRSQGRGIRKIATELKVGVGTIYRVLETQKECS